MYVRRFFIAIACTGVLVAGIVATATPSSAATPGLRPLTIQTVPALPGVAFVLDGRVLTTGRDGAVRTTTTTAEREALVRDPDAHLRVAKSPILVRAGVRASFGRWDVAGYRFDRTNKSGQLLLAAFNLEYLTNFRFTNPEGAVVDPDRLGAMELETSSGTSIKLARPAPIWLLGTYIEVVAGHVRVHETEYKIASVLSRGNNVVHRGEQSFAPSHRQAVTVNVLFFTMRLDVRDAFFGRAVGSTIDIRFADGSSTAYALHDGRVVVPDLPRGDYTIDVRASGLNTTRHVSISRSSKMTIAVFSLLDITIVISGVLVVAAVILVTALRRRRTVAARLARQGAGEPQPRDVAPRAPAPL